MKEDPRGLATGRRRWATLASLVLLVGGQPVAPAVIVVDGSCTLADAIEAANTNAAAGGCPAGDPGADTIRLTDDVELTAALPAMTTEITLEGGDFEVRRSDAAPDFRIFQALDSADVRLENVTISNGRADRGGGVYHDGFDLTLVHATVSDNLADSSGGGIYVGWNTFTTRLYHSTIAGNTAAAFSGGGIRTGEYADLRLTGTTVSGNYAAGLGGGIATANYSSLRLVNSTVSSNVAGGDGGAIHVAYGGPDVVLENSSVIGNVAGGPVGGIYYDSFGVTNLSLSNSIVAYNSGLDCLYPTPIDLGGNFDDDGSCGASPIVPGVDFDLALSDNGGPTRTHRLERGSVAIDAGVDCAHPLDQRGFERRPPCDSGAVEHGVAPVGGSIDGLAGRDVVCRNLTNGDSVTIDLTDLRSWDCEAAGLNVLVGERVELAIRARSDGAAAGSVIGFTGRNAFCRNLTTGDGVAFAIGATAAWSCLEGGLVVSPGDRLRIVVNGTTP